MTKESAALLASIPEIEDPTGLESIPEWRGRNKQSYVRRSTVRSSGGRYYGCFADTFDEACTETKETSVPGISFIQSEGKCETGEDIWSYIH